MEDVIKILRKEFGIESWKVSRSRGKSKESYIAQSETKKVFIKLEKITPALKRLSEIKAAPPIISYGEYKGRYYLIQEFIESFHPESEWFNKNLKLLAQFIYKYHNDKRLIEILSKDGNDYRNHLNNEISYTKDRISRLKLNPEELDEIYSYFNRMRELAEVVVNTNLVPTHTDTNSANFLVTSNELYMVDWEDILLSDPMRDIGLVLFRYYPKDKWEEFMQLYGSNLEEDRIYLWIARGCLDIAEWFGARDDRASQDLYLDAFKAAVDKKENPHFGKL